MGQRVMEIRNAATGALICWAGFEATQEQTDELVNSLNAMGFRFSRGSSPLSAVIVDVTAPVHDLLAGRREAVLAATARQLPVPLPFWSGDDDFLGERDDSRFGKYQLGQSAPVSAESEGDALMAFFKGGK